MEGVGNWARVELLTKAAAIGTEPPHFLGKIYRLISQQVHLAQWQAVSTDKGNDQRI